MPPHIGCQFVASANKEAGRNIGAEGAQEHSTGYGKPETTTVNTISRAIRCGKSAREMQTTRARVCRACQLKMRSARQLSSTCSSRQAVSPRRWQGFGWMWQLLELFPRRTFDVFRPAMLVNCQINLRQYRCCAKTHRWPIKTNLIYWARAGFGNTLGKLVQTDYFCTPLENWKDIKELKSNLVDGL